MKSLKTSLVLLAFLLLAIPVKAAQNFPINVLANTNGTLRFPPNFFAANSNLLNAAVAASGAAFTTGAGVTNISGVVSANLTNGSNITLTTNANGVISIASSGGGSTTTNFASITLTNNVNRGIETLSGTTPTFDWNTEGMKLLTLSGNTTVTITAPTIVAGLTRGAYLFVTGDGAFTFAFSPPPTNRFGTLVSPPRNGITVYFLEQIGATTYLDVQGDITIADVSGLQAALDSLGGSQVWTNIGGVIQPAPGQTTNVLSFTSGLPDNATNLALVVDTDVPWTELSLDQKLVDVRNFGTNIMGVSIWGGVRAGSASGSPGFSTQINPGVHAVSTTSIDGKGFADFTAQAWAEPSVLNNINSAMIDMLVIAPDDNLSNDSGLFVEWSAFSTNSLATGMTFDVSPGNLDFSLYVNSINKFTIDYAGNVTAAGEYISGSTNILAALAGKQPLFTTGAGVTNIANVLSGNYTPGANITLTTNANGAVAIAGTGSAGTAGTVINTGASAISAIPRYTDTTGTNVAPSALSVDAAGRLGFTGTTSVLGLPSLTTTQKNALTPQAGDTVYDSTLGRAQVYDGAAWHSRVRLDGDTMTGALINSVNGALSAPGLSGTGTWITGGSASTTKPYWLIEPAGATSANWSTSGTGLGINAPSGFTGNPFDVQLNGAARFSVAANGAATTVNQFISTLAAGNTAFKLQNGVGSSVAWNGVGLIRGVSNGKFNFENDSQAAFTWLQLGPDVAAPSSVQVKSANGSGTDKPGGDITISGGQPTGTGTPGKVKMSVTGLGTGTGSTVQSYTTAVALGGTLKVDTTTTGNVGAGEDTLITYTIPAQQLGSNGDHIEFRVWGSCASNTNTKDIKIYFGGTVISDGGVTVLNGVSWSAHGMIVRTGAATQTANCELTAGVGVVAQTTTTAPAETLSGTVVFKVTGTSAIAPADNDIIQNGMVLKYFQGL